MSLKITRTMMHDAGLTNLIDHGVGANKTSVAQVAEQTPRAELQPRMTAGVAGAAITVPKVNPAAA